MHTIKNLAPILLFIGVIYLVPACNNSNFGQRADSLFLVTEAQRFHYDVKYPDEKYFLPYVLEEVSGITWKEGNVLAVDDETGKVFEYSFDERDIIHSIHFYKGDDFEGVELVGDEIFVLRSDGDLFKIDYTESKESRGWEIETPLGKKNDTEGLGYDPKTHQLIIACKEKPELKEEKLKGRAFYAFDLETSKLIKEPLFTISPKKLKAFWEANREFAYEEERIKFKPSAIAHHPVDDHYYILSSVGKMIVVVDRGGAIQATYPIASRVLGQPEGITFAPNGDMYISSEGEGDKGYILKFEMKTK